MEAIVYTMPSFTIEAEQAGKTTLSFLKKHYPFSLLSRLFRQGKILLNGKKAKKEDRVSVGDTITLPDRITELRTVAYAPINILFDHEDFAVVNKPSGVSVHSGRSVAEEQSLIGQLTREWATKRIRPFLVHRLDTMTSGCLIVAKNPKVVKTFEQMFRQGKISKEYVALIKGIPEKMQGTIEEPIIDDHGKAQKAKTDYEVIDVYPDRDVSLVRAFPHTGRKHQIRRHFANIGHPLVMDHQYGDFAFNREYQKKYGMKRFYLHAEKVSFQWKGRKINARSLGSPPAADRSGRPDMAGRLHTL